MENPKLVLIDTDAGIDDALAILMVLRAHKDPNFNLKVLGITCVEGNTSVDNVVTNVTTLFDTVGMSTDEIPIYRGASEAIAIPCNLDPKISPHGMDGFGDVISPKSKPRIAQEHAVNAMIRLTKEHKEKLTVLALGPLTNLALAYKMNPTIKNYLKEIILMGGNHEGTGNVSICAEFNFYADPEAAFVTLSCFRCPIVIVPLEVAHKNLCLPYEWRVKVLGSIDSEICRFFNKIEANWLEIWHKEGCWEPYDSTASAVLLEPNIVKKTVLRHCTVELHGMNTRGLLVIDRMEQVKEHDNITIVTELEKALFQKMLIWTLEGAESYKPLVYIF